MATIADLLRRVQVLVDDTIDTTDLIDWFNQCQDDLTEILYLPTSKTLTKNVDGKFVLPDDFNGELKIVSPTTIKSYVIYDNIIYFDGYETTTSLDITYNKLPTELTNTTTQVPDLPASFHDMYVFYAAKMFALMDEESERYTMFDNEYQRKEFKLKKHMAKLRQKPTAWGVNR